MRTGHSSTFLSLEVSSNSLASLAAELPEDKGPDYKATGQEGQQGKKETKTLGGDQEKQEQGSATTDKDLGVQSSILKWVQSPPSPTGSSV